MHQSCPRFHSIKIGTWQLVNIPMDHLSMSDPTQNHSCYWALLVWTNNWMIIFSSFILSPSLYLQRVQSKVEGEQVAPPESFYLDVINVLSIQLDDFFISSQKWPTSVVPWAMIFFWHVLSRFGMWPSFALLRFAFSLSSWQFGIPGHYSSPLFSRFVDQPMHKKQHHKWESPSMVAFK